MSSGYLSLAKQETPIFNYVLEGHGHSQGLRMLFTILKYMGE